MHHLGLHPTRHRRRLLWDVVRETQPDTEPLTVPDLKDDRRVDGSEEDPLLDRRISEAREWCENRQGRSYIKSRWSLVLDRFPAAGRPIRLPRPPLIEVATVEHFDGSDWTALTEGDDYRVSKSGDVGMVHPEEHWPHLSADLQPAEWAVRMTFDAGYGESASDVPSNIRRAIELLAAHWFENREPVAIGTIVTPVPFAVESLLAQNPSHWREP